MYNKNKPTQIVYIAPKPEDHHKEIVQLIREDSKTGFLPDHLRQFLKENRAISSFRATLGAGRIRRYVGSNLKDLMNYEADSKTVYNLNKDKLDQAKFMFHQGIVEMPIVLRNRKTDERWLLSNHMVVFYGVQFLKKSINVVEILY